ncbi:MAG: hypothetical protein AB1468_04435 [Candidatus Micrarchaeota archaeon]
MRQPHMSIENITNEAIGAHILYKLARKRRWGGKHTELRNCIKSLDPKLHERGEACAGALIKKGLLLHGPKTGETHVSLNPARKGEILGVIRKYLGSNVWV